MTHLWVCSFEDHLDHSLIVSKHEHMHSVSWSNALWHNVDGMNGTLRMKSDKSSVNGSLRMSINFLTVALRAGRRAHVTETVLHKLKKKLTFHSQSSDNQKHHCICVVVRNCSLILAHQREWHHRPITEHAKHFARSRF